MPERIAGEDQQFFPLWRLMQLAWGLGAAKDGSKIDADVNFFRIVCRH